ncbi:MAG: hypothetical protein AAF514_09410 [Verrucomicrobiota bacterium]
MALAAWIAHSQNLQIDAWWQLFLGTAVSGAVVGGVLLLSLTPDDRRDFLGNLKAAGKRKKGKPAG